MAQGLLTDRYINGIPADSRMARGTSLRTDRLTPELMQTLNGLKAQAEAADKPMSAIALSWVLQQEGVTSVLIGASSVEQLRKNLDLP